MNAAPGTLKLQTIVVLGASGNGMLMAERVERLPGARLAGFLDDTYAAQGSRFDLPVLGRLQIGVFSTVGMGAVVLRDIPPGEVWGGNPARRLRAAEG